MSKNGISKIQTNMSNWLALRFVDRHRKAKSNRKLAAAKFKWNLCLCRSNAHAWNKHCASCMLACDKPDLQNSVPIARKNPSWTITNSFFWVQISKKTLWFYSCTNLFIISNNFFYSRSSRKQLCTGDEWRPFAINLFELTMMKNCFRLLKSFPWGINLNNNQLSHGNVKCC